MTPRNMRLRVAIEWADTGEQVSLPDGARLEYDEATLIAAIVASFARPQMQWWRRANAAVTKEAEAKAVRQAVTEAVRTLKRETQKVWA